MDHQQARHEASRLLERFRVLDLVAVFGEAANNAPVYAVSALEESKGKFVINVLLDREPTESERQAMSDESDGVDVRYEVMPLNCWF